MEGHIMTNTLSGPAGTPREALTNPGYAPPQALDAERAVLAALLLDRDAVGLAIELLDVGSFYRVAHQKIYDAIVVLYNRNERADLVTLAEELRKRGDLEAIGGPPAISQILEYATTAANLEQHLRLIRSKAILRDLIKATGEIQQEAYAGADDTHEILDRAEERIFAITDERIREGFHHIRDLLKPAFEHIEALSKRNERITGVPSGYDDLDNLTAGFQNSDLIIIAGRPAMGKTSCAMNIAENAAIKARVPVGIFSLEMSKDQLVQRLLCSQGGVALHRVRSGQLSHEDWPRLTTAAGLLTRAPIMIDDSATLSLMEIRAKCRRLKAEKQLGLVVIDYLQLIRPGHGAENRVQEIGQITRGLKALAKELNLPVIALSQLSRAVETRDKSGRPQLSDLRESGCLTADTRILRADTGAEVTMGELLESGERNIPVWTLDDDLRLARGTMTHVFPSGIKPVFELKLASGLTVKASANHPFYTLDGWKPLAQVSEGTRLAVPRRMPAPRSTVAWPEAEVIMLAHLLGDGCFASRQPVHYTSADPANLEAVERAAAHFGITPRRVPQQTWSHVYLPSPYRLTHGKRNPIQAWLARFGLDGRRSYEKFIPREVAGLSDTQIALLLRHLWATDGCVHLGADDRQARIYYASTSAELIHDIRHLLLRFGVLARVKVSTKADDRPGYQLHLYGAENQLRFLELVGVHGARGERIPRITAHLRSLVGNTNVDTVPVEVWSRVRVGMRERGVTVRALAAGLEMAYCGSTMYKHAPSRGRLSHVAALVADPELQRMACSDVFWDTIVSIRPLGEQPVFDATVPGTHNFIANGIFAHNSIEQDADVVMFVYREEVYKPDTAEKGKALIMVAKQRNGPTGDIPLTFLRESTKFVPYTPVMAGETEASF
jgi:replicative DNA helicase